jgi:hypothetical protein
MPTVYRIGATVSTGVDLTDATRYRVPAESYRSHVEYDEAFIPMVGGDPVLARFRPWNRPWDWLIRVTRSAGHQERLTDFAAIQTQITAAINFKLGVTATPIFLWEQFGNQSAVVQYLIYKGYLDEEERIGGGASLHIVGHLHLETRPTPGT